MARNDLPSPNAPNFPQRLREAFMTYLGRTGDPLDRGITLRDLIEGGFARLRDGYTAGQAAATGGAPRLVAPEVVALTQRQWAGPTDAPEGEDEWPALLRGLVQTDPGYAD